MAHSVWTGGSRHTGRAALPHKNIQPYEYFEYLLTEIPKHLEDTNRDFLAELLPWAKTLPEHIKKKEKK